jgi:hypothetical protein
MAEVHVIPRGADSRVEVLIWTSNTWKKYSRPGLRYQSDVTDKARDRSACSQTGKEGLELILARDRQRDLLRCAFGLSMATSPRRFSSLGDRVWMVCGLALRPRKLHSLSFGHPSETKLTLGAAACCIFELPD